jgi:hypothetical protein
MNEDMLSFSRNKDHSEVAVTVTTGTFIRLALLTVGTIILLLELVIASFWVFVFFYVLFLVVAV